MGAAAHAPKSRNGRARASKQDHVYIDLRRRICTLALPPGGPLNADEIARDMGTSRDPVRRAISRLADEALVDIYPQAGSFVAPIRARDMRECMTIRTALEVEAARQAAATGDAAMLARLAANLAQQTRALAAHDLAALHGLDEAMHDIILDFGAPPRARRAIEGARAVLDRTQRIALRAPQRPEATVAEHDAIVGALASGNAEFAGAAMRAHLSKADRVLRESMRAERLAE